MAWRDRLLDAAGCRFASLVAIAVGIETIVAPVGANQIARRAAGVAAALIGLAAVADGLHHIVVSTDTLGLVAGVDSALAHLRSSEMQNWGGEFALLQAIPAFVLRASGMNAAHVVDALVWLNLVSFAGLAWISWRSLVGHSVGGAILLVAVLLSSTLLWYLHSSLGEPLAAVVTLGAVVACWNDGRHLRASALLFLAGLSKDTAVPFLLMLCVGASIGSEHWTSTSWRWRRLGSLLLAGGSSFVVTCAYNYVRFGSVLDVPYLAPFRFVSALRTQASFFAAVWLSPNGGLLLFWPSFGVLLAVATVAAVRAAGALQEWGARLRCAVPFLAVVGVLLGMTLELSRWFTPFGWIAWGPRLILPWVPVSAYLLVAAYTHDIARLLSRIFSRPWLAWLVGTALAVASVPQYVAMVRSDLFIAFLTPDAVCPTVPIIENGAGYYYQCTSHMLWTKGSMLLSAFEPGPSLLQPLAGFACAVALLWLLFELRRAVLAAEPS